MRALITGATGFIGSHLAEALTRQGWEVRCLVRRPSGLGWVENLDVQLVRGDCRDKLSLRASVEGVDYVFHLAGVISALSWDEYFQANVAGTKNLLEAVAERNPGLRKFVYVSSISATGPAKEGQVLSEDDPCLPISDYGRSKLSAEAAIHAFAPRFPFVIIRPPNVIGPRQRELREVVRLIRKRIKPSVGTGEPQTSLCYVGDVVRALILGAEKQEADGRTYFLAYPRPYAWSDVTRAIQETLGIRFFFLKIPYPVQWLAAVAAETAGHLTRKRPKLTRIGLAATRKYYWIYSGARIKRELGFEPRTGLQEAIQLTIAWNDEHGWS
jgi:nucleoside-diphosphate-sugar epimerase